MLLMLAFRNSIQEMARESIYLESITFIPCGGTLPLPQIDDMLKLSYLSLGS